jgi:probable rRNA maturation factor
VSDLLCIDVSSSAACWSDNLSSADALARRAANAVWHRIGRVEGNAEVSIVLGDDMLVRDLNQRYRSQDKATNVLSFPAGDDGQPGMPCLLGDVILAYDTIAREATEQQKPLADHFQHLCVHGILHLLGHDHQEDSDATTMETLEISILADLGIANPYLPSYIPMKTTA